MAWPTRSAVLGLQNQATTAATKYALGAVPSGKTWLCKNLSLYNGTTGARSFYLWLRRSGVDQVIGQQDVGSQLVVVLKDLVWVAEAGDQFMMSVVQASTLVHVSWFGAKLG